MTSAVHSALPKTDRHAPNATQGSKPAKTGTDFQRLLHGGTEHWRAEAKSDDTATQPDSADHDPVHAKLDEKAVTNDGPADLNLAGADPDQHQESTPTSQDGRSALDVLSSLISLNAADRSACTSSPDVDMRQGESAPTNETIATADREIEQPVSRPVEKSSQAGTAKQELHVAPEDGESAVDNSTPANDPKVALPTEPHGVDLALRMPDHQTGEANPPMRPKAPADASGGTSKVPTPPAETASTTRPPPHAEQPATVDARITVSESRQYPAPVVEPGAQKPEKAATAAASTEMPKVTVRSEYRTQLAYGQRTVSSGDGSAPPAAGGHAPARPSTADAASEPAPMKSAGSADTALALNSTTESSGQPSDPPAQPRKTSKIETPAARTDTASGINATVVQPQTTATTGEALATSIADGLAEKKPLAAAANMHVPAAPQHQSAHVLKIELHPAELGAVTASLKVVGEQLSIEIQVENHEAYRRLSNDSDDLTNTLRKLGYDVDRITILQPQPVATPTSRTEAQTSSTNTSSRDQSAAFSSSGEGGNGSGGDGQRSGRNPAHDAYALRDTTPARRDGGRGGIVI